MRRSSHNTRNGTCCASDRYEKMSILQYSNTAYDAKTALSNRSKPNDPIPCIQHACQHAVQPAPAKRLKRCNHIWRREFKNVWMDEPDGLDSPLLIRIPIRAAEDGGVRVLFRFVTIFSSLTCAPEIWICVWCLRRTYLSILDCDCREAAGKTTNSVQSDGLDGTV